MDFYITNSAVATVTSAVNGTATTTGTTLSITLAASMVSDLFTTITEFATDLEAQGFGSDAAVEFHAWAGDVDHIHTVTVDGDTATVTFADTIVEG